MLVITSTIIVGFIVMIHIGVILHRIILVLTIIRYFYSLRIASCCNSSAVYIHFTAKKHTPRSIIFTIVDVLISRHIQCSAFNPQISTGVNSIIYSACSGSDIQCAVSLNSKIGTINIDSRRCSLSFRTGVFQTVIAFQFNHKSIYIGPDKIYAVIQSSRSIPFPLIFVSAKHQSVSPRARIIRNGFHSLNVAAAAGRAAVDVRSADPETDLTVNIIIGRYGGNSACVIPMSIERLITGDLHHGRCRHLIAAGFSREPADKLTVFFAVGRNWKITILLQ